MSYLSYLLLLKATVFIEIWFLAYVQKILLLFVTFELLVAAGIMGIGM
jgi:hypothetical protein